MTSIFKRSHGFTLLELLVVMSIAATGLSLVGPRFFGIYEKIGRSAEEQKLADITGAVSLKAFLRQIDYTMALKDDTLDLKGLETTFTFRYITFPSQAVIFNGNGFADVEGIRYVAGNEEKSLPLDGRMVSNGP